MIIKQVTYVSVWNNKFKVRTPAKLNVETGEVFDIQSSDVNVDADGDELEFFEGQYIEWKHHSIDVEEQDGKYFVQLADYVKEQAASDKTEPLEIQSLITLSTVHITKEASEFLDSSEREQLIVYDKPTSGWFIYLNTDPIEDELPLIPESLASVIRFAISKGCGVLCLDVDGPETDDLSRYEW